ncbi:response regulator transcription factor [Paenibacillus guangzhouensis]|uniref:response regulator transcription factor n=1 Tax=Paenibacillus guangzhouensis TaxID=1473112 RepID=UPI00126712DE|nr:response regulator transcription factor [Paenibacillus guangzhouensis]
MRNVFIVDDEPFILQGLTTVIDWEEFGITLAGKAYDGTEAFEILQQIGSQVDILITDIMMRDMNGLALIERLKPLYPHMKFIVLSGYNEFSYVKEGMRLGIENYLLKPVNMKELTETVMSTVQKLEQADRQAYIVQNQLDILRDNVMARWAAGNIDPAELRNRLEFLEIPMDRPFYAAATVKTVQDAPIVLRSGSDASLWEQQQNSEAYRISQSLVRTLEGSYCYCDIDGDTVILITGASAEAGLEATMPLLEQIRRELKQRLGMHVFITLGSMELSYLDMSQSYAHAKRLQEYFLTHTDNAIISYDRIVAVDEQLELPSMDAFEYERLLQGKDKSTLHAYIDQLFQELQSTAAITPAHIHNRAVELILCTKQVVRDNKLNHELATSGYKQLFTALFRAHTIGQLTAHVKFIADSAIDYLSTEDDEFSAVVKQVLHQIQTNYAEELSLKTLSHTLHIHPFYLGQLFQKETGESFSDYLNAFRIKKAQKLLKTTTMKTSDISRSCGYLEPGYFYKMFKKYTGMSPTQYRGKRDGASLEHGSVT